MASVSPWRLPCPWMIGAAITTHFPVMGIERWYVMFYSDELLQSVSAPPPRVITCCSSMRPGLRDPENAPPSGQDSLSRAEKRSDHRYMAGYATVLRRATASALCGWKWDA